MKNTLLDLNNHLFTQLERLNEEDLKGEQLKEEIERSKAIQGVAGVAVANAKIALDAKRFQTENGLQKMPEMLAEKTAV